MNTHLDSLRECLLDQVFTARTLPEIEAAKVVLRQWIADHPAEEFGMRDGFEVLSHREDYALEQEAQKSGALAGVK